MTFRRGYDILLDMKNKVRLGLLKTSFQKEFKAFYPVAHGTLTFVRKPCNNPNCSACKSGDKHPAWMFTFRKDGRHHCMHVQPRHVDIIREAIENGKRLEEMILEEGIALLEKLREQE